jgi:hypothetical protein
MIYTFHNGFKITDWFENKVKVETFDGSAWIFLFGSSSLDSAKELINLMNVKCVSSVSQNPDNIYKGFRLVEWDGGVKVEIYNLSWKFVFNSMTIESAKNAINLMFPKHTKKIKYNGYKILIYGVNEVVEVNYHKTFLFDAQSIEIAKNAIDIIINNKTTKKDDMLKNN